MGRSQGPIGIRGVRTAKDPGLKSAVEQLRTDKRQKWEIQSCTGATRGGAPKLHG